MKITKFGHSCLLIEENGVRILTDPGTYSTQQSEVKNLELLKVLVRALDSNSPLFIKNGFCKRSHFCFNFFSHFLNSAVSPQPRPMKRPQISPQMGPATMGPPMMGPMIGDRTGFMMKLKVRPQAEPLMRSMIRPSSFRGLRSFHIRTAKHTVALMKT